MRFLGFYRFSLLKKQIKKEDFFFLQGQKNQNQD